MDKFKQESFNLASLGGGNKYSILDFKRCQVKHNSHLSQILKNV